MTDIVFHIPAANIYLSPIIDCFNDPASKLDIWTSPNAELVNTMFDKGIFIKSCIKSSVREQRVSGCVALFRLLASRVASYTIL